MQDAINQVKTDLGRDAVILQTRRLKKGGFFGFFAKEQFEVMAAVDNISKIAVQQPNPSYYPTIPPPAKSFFTSGKQWNLCFTPRCRKSAKTDGTCGYRSARNCIYSFSFS